MPTAPAKTKEEHQAIYKPDSTLDSDLGRDGTHKGAEGGRAIALLTALTMTESS
jgi:hypothetical protein